MPINDHCNYVQTTKVKAVTSVWVLVPKTPVSTLQAGKWLCKKLCVCVCKLYLIILKLLDDTDQEIS